MLGDPDLIFLDEPTTGIDPYSKRQLWTVINKTRNSGKTVVLTTHLMDECEVLCNRVAIMVAGEFKCLGSVQHLKNKYKTLFIRFKEFQFKKNSRFSKGFIMTIKMNQENEAQLNEMQNRVHNLFPSVILKEKYIDLLTFHINSATLKWSEVFAAIFHLKNELEIIDYSITQMNFEQVFLHFTRDIQKVDSTDSESRESRMI